MNVLLVYLLLLKATVTSFAGMGSLPQIQQDFVETYRLVSADALSKAVLVGRATPIVGTGRGVVLTPGVFRYDCSIPSERAWMEVEDGADYAGEVEGGFRLRPA